MAADSLLVNGARGDPADGFCRALMMSLAAALMVSTDDAVGMVTFVGNQAERVADACAAGFPHPDDAASAGVEGGGDVPTVDGVWIPAFAL